MSRELYNIPNEMADIIEMLPKFDPYREAAGCCFDTKAAQRAIAFFPSCLRLVKGMPGKPRFTLQPWQQAIVANIFGWKNADGTRRFRKAWIYIGKKNGKALALNTPIPTPSGWTTMGEVQEGDVVFDENGKRTTVIGVTDVMHGRPCNKVHFSDGSSIIADDEHQWTVRVLSKDYAEQTLTTAEMKKNIYCGAARNYSVIVKRNLECGHVDLPIDPYALGVWLGDGDKNSARISIGNCKLPIRERIQNRGTSVTEFRPDPRQQSGACTISDGTVGELRKLGLINNKHIPAMYLRASSEQRLDLLRGLMDTDGTINKKGLCEFNTSNPSLAEGSMELLRTLGYKPMIKWKIPKIGFREYARHYVIQFQPWDDANPFTLPSKASRVCKRPKGIRRSQTIQITKIEEIESVPVKCIAVDSPSHLYLAGRGMIQTHNTAFAAGLLLYMLVCDNEPGAEIYGAASSKDQAALVFAHAAGMVMAEPALNKLLTIYGAKGGGVVKSIVRNDDPTCSYRVISADADTGDGINPHFAIIDETHRLDKRDFVDMVESSTAARKQALVVHITTADYNRPSVCNENLTYARQVRDGIINDPKLLPAIWEATKDDDWEDPATWRKANPNMGVTVTEEMMRDLALKAKNQPSFLNTFLRLHLNIVTESFEAWISDHHWKACAILRGAMTPIEIRQDQIERLRGRKCYLGMDLGSTKDLTSIAALFPQTIPYNSDTGVNQHTEYDVLSWFWIPGENAVIRAKEDSVNYPQWHREGWLEYTPGAQIDYDAIRRHINWLAKQFNVEEIGYDPWAAQKLAPDLYEKDGLPMVEVRQGYITLSEPSKHFESSVLSHWIHHDSNPILTWNIANCTVIRDTNDNIRPDKKKSTERIDGVVAIIIGLALAMQHERQQKTPYQGGMLVL